MRRFARTLIRPFGSTFPLRGHGPEGRSELPQCSGTLRNDGVAAGELKLTVPPKRLAEV
ncbi:hypothetical protein QE400_003998 [Xanthomonas sacchari]|nr:hypothetical protein [Xanthomonas sacchari]